MKILLKKTFQQKYSHENFKVFLAKAFQKSAMDFEFKKVFQDNDNERFADTRHLLSFETDDNKTIEVLSIELKKKSNIEVARSYQRSLIEKYIKWRIHQNQWVDGVLVAFWNGEEKTWRLSLVTMDLKDGKKVFTPPKRSSFLIGEGESTHTAEAQFHNVLKHGETPLYSQLQEVFSVEKVTDEFFEEYKKHFLALNKKFLENEIFQKEVVEKQGVKNADFVKKLMGQIVFLYFLQKKGWLGVAEGQKWGTGDKNFMRKLLNECLSGGDIKKERGGKNFFNDYLEHLFYNTLNNKHRGRASVSGDYSWSEYFGCKIPYLNGGLFEAIYEWETTYIDIPNSIFEDIFATFDRYNFTVHEADNLETDVAVDPEMLGKVFENLLEIDERKGKGAFYTPREIVHYMCQESLVNYLTNASGYPEERIRKLMKRKDEVIAKDDTERKIFEENQELKDIAERVYELLKIVTVCDPAVGSGAFPMGMMKEIVSLRFFLNRVFIKEINEKTKKQLSEYDIKKETLENCIYGVDIESGAIEICRLRFWLSMIVEHDIEDVEPLPNLDYKLMQGNSLLSEYEGIKLFDESILDKEKKVEQLTLGLGKTKTELKLETLKHKADLFINESDKQTKKKLKGEIDELKWEIIEESMIEQGRSDKLKEIKDWRNKNEKPFFLWKLEFSDIFKKGGFDIVIGNPPYITYKGKQKVDTLDSEITAYLENYKNSAEYKINSYALFIERAFSLLKKAGIISYIIPSTILQNEYLGKIRKYILENYHIDLLVTFENKVFEAVTDSIILQCSKRRKNTVTKTLRKSDLEFSDVLNFVDWSQDDWLKNDGGVINFKISVPENKILFRIEQNSEDLEIFLNANIGIKRANAPIKITKISDKYKKFIVGGELLRFSVKSKGNFILFDKSFFHTGVDENIFLQKEKILVRKTGNILIASYDSSQFYTDQSIYNIYLKNGIKDVSLKYICALLNSKILNWYFNKKMITNADVFPYIKGIHLKKLPIKKISLEAQTPFIELVNQVLEITSRENYDPKNPPKEQKELEKQIDAMVFDLYGLDDEERDIVLNS